MQHLCKIEDCIALTALLDMIEPIMQMSYMLQDDEECAAGVEALKLLSLMISTRPVLIQTQIDIMLKTIWELLCHSFPLHMQHLTADDDSNTDMVRVLPAAIGVTDGHAPICRQSQQTMPEARVTCKYR